MKIIDFLLILISTSLLVVNQILFKLWIHRYNVVVFPINLRLIRSIISFEILGASISLLVSGLLWISLLKKLPFSILYPMVSVSYVLGLLSAKYIFNEQIPLLRWIGVIIIIAGIIIVAKS